MTARHADFEVLTVKNRAYLRTYYLIRDPEFIESTEKLRQDIMASYPPGEGFFSFEPDALLDTGTIQESIDNMVALAKHHHVSVDFLGRYLDGSYPLEGTGLFHELPVRAKVEDGWIVLRTGLDITSPQFKQLWGAIVTITERPLPTDNLVQQKTFYLPPYIENGWVVLKVSKDLKSAGFRQLWADVSKVLEAHFGVEEFRTRRRMPSNPELVYYIEKALENGSSFTEITGLYNDGKLPGYNHQDGEKEYSIDELRDYYNDYKFLR